jgi:RNA recognition motif-containing protein
MESYYEDFFTKPVDPKPKKPQPDDQPKKSQESETMSKHSSSGKNSQQTPKFQKPQIDQNFSSKIYVSNMKPGTDEGDLHKIFSRFGEVTEVSHKGTYAFVNFTEAEAAQKAIRQDHGTMRVMKAYSSNKQQPQQPSYSGGSYTK